MIMQRLIALMKEGDFEATLCLLGLAKRHGDDAVILNVCEVLIEALERDFTWDNDVKSIALALKWVLDVERADCPGDMVLSDDEGSTTGITVTCQLCGWSAAAPFFPLRDGIVDFDHFRAFQMHRFRTPTPTVHRTMLLIARLPERACLWLGRDFRPLPEHPLLDPKLAPID